MYQFSRAIYRELSPLVTPDRHGHRAEARERLLRACEGTMERIAADRFYFARPARTLFADVRDLFPIQAQLRAYHVITSTVTLAGEYVDQHARQGVSFDGSPLICHATTRKGTPCQRLPVPGGKYCPSHKHLAEDRVVVAA